MTTRAEFLALLAARGRCRGEVVLLPGFDRDRDPEDCWVISEPAGPRDRWTTFRPGRSGEPVRDHDDESRAYRHVLDRLPALLPEQRHVTPIAWQRGWFLEELRNRAWFGPRFVFGSDPADEDSTATVVIDNRPGADWTVYEHALGPAGGRQFGSETDALRFVVAHYLGWA